MEESRAFPAAFEIVQRLAQRAADAGDDVAARRYTEKMRSLRVLVGNRRGEERPEPARGDAADAAAVVAPPPAPRPERFALEPGRVELPATDPTVVAPRADAPEKNAAAVEFLAPVPGGPRSGADTPPAALVTDESTSPAGTGATAALDGEDDTLVIETTAHADDDRPAGTHATDDPVEFVIETTSPEIEIEIEPVETGGFAEGLPAEAAGDDLEATAKVFETLGEPESEPMEVHEYELTDTSFADVAAMLQAEEERLAREPAAAAPAPVPPAPAKRAAPGQATAPEQEFVEPVWIPDDLLEDSLPGHSSGQFHELEEVIDTFRQQMARALGDDASARYDLGVAYYEMGLYNEALAEFQSALPSVEIRERCLEMMAACLAMQGRHAEIVSLLSPILEAPGASGLGPGLRYSMGVAYEALGRREEARRHFEEVALVDSGFRDVAARLHRF